MKKLFRMMKNCSDNFYVLHNMLAKGKKQKKQDRVKVADKDAVEGIDVTPEQKKKKKKVSKLLRAKLSDSDDDDISDGAVKGKKKKSRKASEHREESGSGNDSDVVVVYVSFLCTYSHFR